MATDLIIKPLPELLGAGPSTRLDWIIWNKLLAEAQSRLSRLEILRGGLEAAYAQASDIALERINEVLGPAIETIQADLVTIGEMIAGAAEALDQAADDALAQIQPQIDDKLAAVDLALTGLATAISQANAARDGANTAAAAANAAASGVGAAIAAALAETQAEARRTAIRMAFAQ